MSRLGMKSSNPSIKKLWSVKASDETYVNAATYKGVAWKAFYFVMLTICFAVLSAVLLFKFPAYAIGIAIGCGVGTLVFGLIAAFCPRTVKVTGTLYTMCEGFLVGAVSAIVGAVYGGIVLAALLSTFGVFAVMMILYVTGAIKVTHKFRNFMYSALLGVILMQLVIGLTALFVPAVRTMFYGNNWFTLLISIVMVVFASFFILVDLYEITAIVQNGLDKKYEWRAAFSLVLTLIWLYLEFLELFARLKQD